MSRLTSAYHSLGPDNDADRRTRQRWERVAQVLQPIQLTPDEFEEEVQKILAQQGLGLAGFQVERLEKLPGPGGEYEIDITARFEALCVDFLVLVECKRHRDPIKRDIVQVLHSRIQEVGAHKGIIFATTAFQRGAVEFAKAHGIALVQIADGRTSYVARAENAMVDLPLYVGWVVSADDTGEQMLSLLDGDPGPLLDTLGLSERR